MAQKGAVQMLIAGFAGSRGKSETISLIKSLLIPLGNKINVVDSKIIAELDEKGLKGYFTELAANKVDILIIKMSIFDINNLITKNVRLDVLVFTDKLEDMTDTGREKYSGFIVKTPLLMRQKGIVIVNMDDNELISLLHGIKHHTLTYGFNPKASITASSIGDTDFKGSFVCCLQRTVYALNGMIFEPQEYKLNIESGNLHSYNVLASVSFALINGIDLSLLNA
jgi:UDP-N-acetylmuramate-alanine ligase